jgi:hypothetical protein
MLIIAQHPTFPFQLLSSQVNQLPCNCLACFLFFFSFFTYLILTSFPFFMSLILVSTSYILCCLLCDALSCFFFFIPHPCTSPDHQFIRQKKTVVAHFLLTFQIVLLVFILVPSISTYISLLVPPFFFKKKYIFCQLIEIICLK